MRESAPYAQVPYLGGLYPLTHPDTLATIGGILGMAVAPPEQARVLEVGCADGANLMGMAACLPQGTFVGIDGEPSQIAHGEALRQAAGLHNVTLRIGDLRDLSPENLGGTFDYIIAHGVFSWVAPDAQAALLRLCRQALRPQGIAYISYNTFPGWHAATIVRDLMRFRTRALAARGADPDALLDAALQIVTLAAPHDPLYASYARYLPTLERDYLFHDYLADHNQPLLLADFIDRIAPFGLQYLGDAEPHRSLGLTLPLATQRGLDRLTTDPIAREQYLDVLTSRELRRSLLTHAEVALLREADARVLLGLQARSALVPSAADGGRSYHRPADPSAILVPQTRDQRRTLERLRAAWPGAIPIEDIETAELIWSCFLRGLATAHRWSPPLVPPHAVGERPQVTALVRAQAARGLPLTSAWLQGVGLPADHPTLRTLVTRLDGTYAPSAAEQVWVRRLAAAGLILDVRRPAPPEHSESPRSGA